MRSIFASLPGTSRTAMTRKRTIQVAIGAAAALGAAGVGMSMLAGGVRSIQELGDVYYSAPGHWAEFYVNRAPPGTGWVHLPQDREAGRLRAFCARARP